MGEVLPSHSVGLGALCRFVYLSLACAMAEGAARLMSVLLSQLRSVLRVVVVVVRTGRIPIYADLRSGSGGNEKSLNI